MVPWWDFVNKVMELQVIRALFFLTYLVSIRFSKRNLFDRTGWLVGWLFSYSVKCSNSYEVSRQLTATWYKLLLHICANWRECHSSSRYSAPFISNNTTLIILFRLPQPVCHHYVTPTSPETTQILIESCDWWWIIPREALGAMERGTESAEMSLCARMKYSLLQMWQQLNISFVCGFRKRRHRFYSTVFTITETPIHCSSFLYMPADHWLDKNCNTEYNVYSVYMWFTWLLSSPRFV
jgi:hypothetical protein